MSSNQALLYYNILEQHINCPGRLLDRVSYVRFRDQSNFEFLYSNPIVLYYIDSVFTVRNKF